MSDFTTFLQFGFRHIIDVAAMDHILFLVALAAIYRWRDARNVFWVVTAFTIGHSITLALAVTGTLALPTSVIEFLIPVTIVLTGLANLAGVSKSSSLASLGTTRTSSRQERNARPRDLLHQYHRPLLAGVFGLIHGAGFANYLRALFVNDLAAPLFGFNVGIEIGQIVVLLATAVALTMFDTIIATFTTRWPALAMRTATVSLLVVAVGTAWAVERSPW
jgi:hypothetical protein